MLAKVTGANQLTFLEDAGAVFGGIEYFDVTKENGRIVLTPFTCPRRMLSGRNWLNEG